MTIYYFCHVFTAYNSIIFLSFSIFNHNCPSCLKFYHAEQNNIFKARLSPILLKIEIIRTAAGFIPHSILKCSFCFQFQILNQKLRYLFWGFYTFSHIQIQYFSVLKSSLENAGSMNSPLIIYLFIRRERRAR